jgi:outer membrane protein OmpA-like peptidoglycan-associated protein/tetratricopeptide (TPR) repeat protein
MKGKNKNKPRDLMDLKPGVETKSHRERNLNLSRVFIFLAILIFGLLSLSDAVKAQQLPTDSLKGMKSYDEMDYSNALTYLLRYYKKKPTRRNIFAIADCYRHIQNYSEAEIWYKKAVDLGNVPSKVRFYYAESLQSNGKYYKAIKQYILTKPIDESEVKLTERRIYSCVMADSIAKLIPNRFDIRNAKEINSWGSEFGILPFKYGKIFISDRILEEEKDRNREDNKNVYHWTDRAFLKMYFLDQDTIKGTNKITPFDDIIHNIYHSGPLVFNKKQDLLFFTVAKKVNPKKITTNKKVIENFINRLEIYYSRKIDGIWTPGVPLPFNDVLKYSVGHPALSPDEKILYFSSDMPGGYGGTDIYYAQIGPNFDFGPPVNAGPVINTEGNEMFPVFQPSGDLYYSSDGLVGLGGLDIFRTRGEKTKWLKPANLGSPVNSSKDDFSFLTQGKDIVGGYFTSNRDGGMGSDDLYSFRQIRPLPPLESADGVPMIQDSLIYAQIQKDNFPSDSIEYLKLYSPKINPVLTRVDSSIAKGANLTRVRYKLKNLKVNNIGHEVNQFQLDSIANREIDSVALILFNNPLTQLKIVGHADPRGSDDYNMKLSQKRALEVSQKLARMGINKKRLQVSWKGSREPLFPCPVTANCTEEEYARNRRTELNVIGLASSIMIVEQVAQDSIQSPIGIKMAKIPKESSKVKRELPLAVRNKPAESKRMGTDSLQTQTAKVMNDKISAEDLRILQDSMANHNELFNAFGEMNIDTVYLNSRNLLVIRETDGTIQRVFLPKNILSGDQLIMDQSGNQWIIRRNRRVIKIRKQ